MHETPALDRQWNHFLSDVLPAAPESDIEGA